MPDKLTQIQSTQAIVDTDLFATVQDMATTPVTKGKAMSLLRQWCSDIVLMAQSNVFSPNDSTTYYFGVPFSKAPGTDESLFRVHIPKSGTVTKIYLQISNGGTLGSSEQFTISFRLNNATDTVILTTATTNNTVSYVNNTALSIPVLAGDFFSIKLVTPAWATNPTNVQFNAIVYVK